MASVTALVGQKGLAGALPGILRKRFAVPLYSLLGQVLLPLALPRCDIFFSPHFSTTVLPLAASRRVTTVHDVFHLGEAASLGFAQRQYARFLYAAAIQTADTVIAVSEFTRGEILKHFNWAYGKIRVVPNGIDRSCFFRDLERQEIEGPYALFVGNLKPHKNLVTATEALTHCEDKGLRLAVVGAAKGFITGMGRQLAELKPNKRVMWLGELDDIALRKLYSRAECLLFPSLYEGFGYPALEAMACGCPVVCSDIGALREICGNAAMFCDPVSPEDFGRAIARLRTDRALRFEMVERGMRQVDAFPLSRFQEATWQLLLGGDGE